MFRAAADRSGDENLKISVGSLIPVHSCKSVARLRFSEGIELPFLDHRLRDLPRYLELLRLVKGILRGIDQQLLQLLIEDLRDELWRVRHGLAGLVNNRHGQV